MQSKSTFPARIVPFSVPLGRMEAVQGLRKARKEQRHNVMNFVVWQDLCPMHATYIHVYV